MIRLIDADELKRCLDEGVWNDAIEVVDEQPTVEAAPVVHGEWTRKRTIMHDGELWCTNCGNDSPEDKPWGFCPNCGAKMDG